MSREFKAPYRVGRNLGRAVLDANGYQVVVFPGGMEQHAQEYADYLNNKENLMRKHILDFLDVNNWLSLDSKENATKVVDVYLQIYK